MYTKVLLIGLALSSCFSSMSFADENACIQKSTRMQGQPIELLEKCILSFPGYGRSDLNATEFGRDYRNDQDGLLFVFSQVAQTGKASKDFGTRSYYLLPVRQKPDFEVNQDTGELVIHLSSGETMILNRDFKIRSFTGVEFEEVEKSSDANKGGLEIKSYGNGILLDAGWTHSNYNVWPQNSSIFKDRRGVTCKVLNKEIFDFKKNADDSGSAPGESSFKYPAKEDLRTYLSKRCPKLDLSPLE